MNRQNDISVSPMTRSPAPSPPIEHQGASKPSKLRNDMSVDDMDASKNEEALPSPFGRAAAAMHKSAPTTPLGTATPISKKSSNPAEATDYLNGGLPHEKPVSPAISETGTFAPPRSNGATPNTSRPSSIRIAAPAAPVAQWTGSANGTLAGTSTPPARRSVQFARETSNDAVPVGSGVRSPTRWDSMDSGVMNNNAAGGEAQDGKSPMKRDNSSSLMAKLKALTLTGTPTMTPSTQTHGHSRSKSEGRVFGYDGGLFSASAPHSPVMERFGSTSGVPRTLREEESDADAEETADEDAAGETIRPKKRMRIRRPPWAGGSSEKGIENLTAPTTPSREQSGFADSPSADRGRYWRNPIRRRNTLPEHMEDRAASEGEGQERMSAWRRGSQWMTGGRGQSYTGSTPNDPATPRRPGTLRRLTGIGGSDNEGLASPGPVEGRRQFLGFNRSDTAGAAVRRWGVMRHGLKLLGQKKEVHLVDYKKSAELMAELRAGAPAALMLASMIQRDEHGNKRIPVLLEQLKMNVTDSYSDKKDKDKDKKKDGKDEDIEAGKTRKRKLEEEDNLKDTRHIVFRLELEYGSGQNRMKWVIERSLRDFLNLHLRYKLQASTDKYLQLRDIEHRPKQPKFPRSAFPYLRGVPGLGDSDSEDDTKSIRNAGGPPSVRNADAPPSNRGGELPPTPADTASAAGAQTAGEQTHDENEFPGMGKRKKSRPFAHRRKSSVFVGGDAQMGGREAALREQRRLYNERQRRQLEQYLQAMIRWLIFRADSNRLCKFLELSALGVRLAAEGSYHGKEGFLVITTRKGFDLGRLLDWSAAFRRAAPKWFLVRHSYMVCVDSPENMQIYDVFLLDSKWKIQENRNIKQAIKETNTMDLATRAKRKASYPQHHRLKVTNGERIVDLLAKNERILRQFEGSIRFMVKNSLWSRPNRFDSFAPVRQKVFAQWLVDGRDYMWNVSRAINMAKDVIYIHDWWLSPQLYMRRPAAISQKWRLDRLLRKKAREGVKVFIIIYRNVEAAVPIDSEFTKSSMLDLHPNIFVQRSPNQFKKNQFFFAHHEKICIVDHTIAFVGGIDLCFGRWDTPQHSVTDDKPTGFEPSDGPKDSEHCQLWPGKDYSNPRVQDFYALNAPYAEMYDRSKTPRMPWHDVSMQVVGQPARDLTRHFVQRWNYVLRGRKPTRPTPFLLPPPDYNPAELEALGLTGTCEVQILRSACNWSLGIQEPEHSIMSAYCKMIEESDHFVYMENQFFITSCETMGVKIVNKIGDAIVERAVRAAKNGENWRCVILIPLMPGFQNTVDAPDGTSVRLIMQCQYRSICRGEQSIFGRLRNEGIEPEDFVSFYSLRSWGRIGPKKQFVTEQLYIHAKVIIVDDRVALIGSANINERSMLGTRDSECAAVVRDTDLINSTMGGKPYLVGRFAHTLRMRLMREHLGVDVDAVMEEERRAELDREEEQFEKKMSAVYDGPDEDDEDVHNAQDRPGYIRARNSEKSAENRHAFVRDEDEERLAASRPDMGSRPKSFNRTAGDLDTTVPDYRYDSDQVSEAVALEKELRLHMQREDHIKSYEELKTDVEGLGVDQMKVAEETGLVRGRDSTIINGREVLLTSIAAEGHGTLDKPVRPHLRVSSPSAQGSVDEVSIGNISPPPIIPAAQRQTSLAAGLPQLSQLPKLPIVDDTDIGGPPVISHQLKSRLDPEGVFESGATSETYMEYNPLTADIKPVRVTKDCMKDPINDTFFEDTWTAVAENNTKIFRRVFRCNPDNEVTNWHEYTEFQAYAERYAEAQGGGKSEERQASESKGKSGPTGAGNVLPSLGATGEAVTNLMEKSISRGSGGGGEPEGNIKEWADAADAQNEKRGDTHDSQMSEKNSDFTDTRAAKARKASAVSGNTTGPVGDRNASGLGGINERLNTAGTATTGASGGNGGLAPLNTNLNANGSTRGTSPSGRTTFADQIPPSGGGNGGTSPAANLTCPLSTTGTHQFGSTKTRRRRGTTKSRKGFSASDDLLTREEAESLLDLVQGSLVVFPTEWLRREEEGSNWLYQVDMVAPLQIYD